MLITLLIIYILSFLACYFHTKIAHSKDGRYRTLNANGDDLLAALLPLFNTLIAIISWFCFYPYKDKNINFNKFFRVKK